MKKELVIVEIKIERGRYDAFEIKNRTLKTISGAEFVGNDKYSGLPVYYNRQCDDFYVIIKG